MTKKRSPAPEAPRWYRGKDVPMPVSRRFARQVAERFGPRKIILFGSYAYGTPHEDSDVDLLVIKQYRGQPYRESARLCGDIRRSFALDLIVRSPSELARRIAMNDWFLIEATAKGITLYDA